MVTSSKEGRLDIILGCMFSGKSNELIRRVKRYRSIGKRTILINYIDDNRYSTDCVSTHDDVHLECVKVRNLSEIDINYDDYDVIAIDEGQFFKDLYIFIATVLKLYKKDVIVASLDGDYQQQVFGDVLQLIPLADDVIKLKALCVKCSDGTSASFTKKIINSNIKEEIGGSDKYTSVCRFHLLN